VQWLVAHKKIEPGMMIERHFLCRSGQLQSHLLSLFSTFKSLSGHEPTVDSNPTKIVGSYVWEPNLTEHLLAAITNKNKQTK
jgi:hypothetical protein